MRRRNGYFRGRVIPLNQDIGSIPAWLGAGVVTAAVATLAYIAKAIWEWIGGLVHKRRQRRTALVQLNALLRATAVTFLLQRKNVDRLCKAVEKRTKRKLSRAKGYEQFLSTAYPKMTKSERELHGIVRAITEHMMRPLNQAVLKWIDNDEYFRSRSGGGDYGRLARHLAELELHLLMWNAKYQAWIPDRPNHALVYLDDESEHGIGFPHEIGGALNRVMKIPADKP